MCGILALISHEFIRHPSLEDCSDSWYCNDSEKIRHLAYREHELSQSDMNKLNHQEELRILNQQLVKLGNNIKSDQSVEIEKVQTKINQLIGDQEIPIKLFNDSLEEFDYLIPYITSRGPDYIQYNHFQDTYNFQLFSSILSLRQPFTSQPVFKDHFILQFNGEIYEPNCEFSNDTEYLIDQIISEGIDVLSRINGEFAIVLLDTSTNIVYFGRDKIGKRSLCYKLGEELIISSVGLLGYEECKGNTLYKLELETFTLETLNYAHEFKPLNSLYEGDIVPRIEGIYHKLKKSCFIRQETIFPLTSTEADLAVLFSGGLDCTIIAALLLENYIEMNNQNVNIDLLTVGFDNPRTGLSADSSPDRQLSIKSWFHLAKKFPSINLRLIEIDIDYKSWLLHKSTTEELMYPQQTEMDLSIAIAFYFASNNVIPGSKVELTDYNVDWDQFIQNRPNYTTTSNYISSAKVLFSGLGADELFGGYSRHESLFTSLSPDSDTNEAYGDLSKSLIHDINVIYERNLGRDDRVISGWGKELRYPYLDVGIVNYIINEIEPNLKIKLEWTTTKKGKVIAKPIRKWILRQVAQYMELPFVQHELKRAIQFGAKSAKMEIGQSKVKGTDSLH